MWICVEKREIFEELLRTTALCELSLSTTRHMDIYIYETNYIHK